MCPRISRNLFVPVAVALTTALLYTMSYAMPVQPLTMREKNGRFPPLAHDLSQLHGMNYFPKDYPWEELWLNYPAAIPQIERELQIAHSLGINAVRIFIPYNLFSGANPTYPEYLADYLRRLHNHHLAAIVTLFDFYPSQAANPYQPSNESADFTHINTVYSAIHRSPALFAWDLKNEMDRDYAQFGKPAVTTWARNMISHLRTLDGDHPVTIGFLGVTQGTLCYDSNKAADVYDPSIAAELADVTDFVAVHYFLSERCFEQDLAALQTAVSPQPILLEEFGLPTNPHANPSHTEAEQAAYTNALLSLSHAKGIAGTFFWTLNDLKIPPGFPNIPTEQCMGILRNSNVPDCQTSNPTDYSPKPAAAVVAAHYRPNIVYLDLFNCWVDPATDLPPLGWADNWQEGGLFMRCHDPNRQAWSHTSGHIALFKFVNEGTSNPGLATSPLIQHVNVTHTPLITGLISSYEKRDLTFGTDSTLTIGVKEGNTITPLYEITPQTPFPHRFRLDLRQAPLNWQGNHTFQIVFLLEAIPPNNGYSATYEIDWVALQRFHFTHLPLIQ